MTEKDLKRLSRADLLELLIDQSTELQKTQERLMAAEAELDSRRIAIDKAGNIAEAALKLNGVFEAVQASCEQYMENIRALSERQDEAERRCAAMEAETKEKCAQMLAKAEAECKAYWDEISKKLEAFCANHVEARELLSFPKISR